MGRLQGARNTGNIAFGFLVMNGDKYLEKNFVTLNALGLPYNSSRFFYVENDSSDHTKAILRKLKMRYNNLHGESVTQDGKYSTRLCDKLDHNCYKRTRRLAQLRQRVLDAAMKWTQCDVFVMVDLDFTHVDASMFHQAVSYLSTRNLDAIFGMSLDDAGEPYDYGAIVPPAAVDTIRAGIEEFVQVVSAFSGFGIYNARRIREASAHYNPRCTGIEHIDFNTAFDKLEVWTRFHPLYCHAVLSCSLVTRWNIMLTVIICACAASALLCMYCLCVWAWAPLAWLKQGSIPCWITHTSHLSERQTSDVSAQTL
jgi:hypothetical protein